MKYFIAYHAATDSHEPSETLKIGDKTYEGEVKNFVEKVLTPQGWEVIKWTRLPYLCEGDMQQAFYWLDDVIFVIQPKSTTTDESPPLSQQESDTCDNPAATPTTSFWISSDQ